MDRRLKIVIENCPQNHKCPAVNVCPVGALSQKDFEAPKIDIYAIEVKIDEHFKTTKSSYSRIRK